MIDQNVATGVLVFVGFLFSIVVHECAHGVVANWCGDDTALRLGRITLNPIPHIDPLLSVIMPLVLWMSHAPAIFGGAKPVPVNAYNLRNPRRDMMWVAWAGPVSNILLAIGFALLGNLVALTRRFDERLSNLLLDDVLWQIVLINMVLAGFNLIPVPPLDGSRILVGLLPPSMALPIMRLEPYGMLLVALLIFIGVTSIILIPVYSAAHWLWETLVFLR
jgi:Zn-dependent protease